jgi:hypothetical protein
LYWKSTFAPELLGEVERRLLPESKTVGARISNY